MRGEYVEIQHEHDGMTTDAWQGSLDIVDAPVGAESEALAHSS